MSEPWSVETGAEVAAGTTLRPKGPQYKFLTRRGRTIYYVRRVGRDRLNLSTRTSDWDEAAAWRQLYEERTGTGAYLGQEARFREFSQRWRRDDTEHLAPTTRDDLSSYLREGGPILGFFGDRTLREIDARRLRAWWQQEVTGSGRTVRTGRAYLNVVSNFLGYSVDLELLEQNPVGPFRDWIRRRQRTQMRRAAAESTIHPGIVSGWWKRLFPKVPRRWSRFYCFSTRVCGWEKPLGCNGERWNDVAADQRLVARECRNSDPHPRDVLNPILRIFADPHAAGFEPVPRSPQFESRFRTMTLKIPQHRPL